MDEEIWLDKPKYTNVKSIDGEQSQIPKNTWRLCPSCMKEHLLVKLRENLNICFSCEYHFPLDSTSRIEITCDEGSFSQTNKKIFSLDPLSFSHKQGNYKAKIKETREKLGIDDALVYGIGKIDKLPVVIAAMDFRFIGGSMGSVVGENLYRAMSLSIKKKYPFVVFSCSGGARMQEGLLSLMQMAKSCAGVENMNNAKVPFLSIFTHPTMGGVTASFASVADVMIGEPGAHIGFAGPRVIEQTVKQKLPPGFQTSEFLLENGFLDMVVHRTKLRETIAQLIRFLS